MDNRLRDELLDQLKTWATTLAGTLGTRGVFVFGSLVYRDGAQFNVASSDIDLVILFPEKENALTRTNWLSKFGEQKVSLEGLLGKMLERADPKVPIVSCVVVTGSEIAADIHKDGSSRFFSTNLFLDVLAGSTSVGLKDARTLMIRESLLTDCFRFAQKKRNTFVGLNADGAGGLPAFDDNADPVPKDIMRHAAMAAALSEIGQPPGAEFDTQRGLDLLSTRLYNLRGDDVAFEQLHNALSVRRGARGERRALSAKEQMLLTELVYDLAAEPYRAQQVKSPTLEGKASTVIFSERFAQAFPGVREIEWFEDLADIKQRMTKLLEGPLVYSDSTPIWWFGEGNLHIEQFASIGEGLFLMNVEELKIRRIAAIPGRIYYQNFVYVECDPMPATGLYEGSEQYAAKARSRNEFYSEEYGLLDDNRLITRAEFDDGAALIEGKLVDVRGRTQLRVRHLTAYSFVIAPAQSPINKSEFDDRLVEHLHAVISGKDSIESLAADVQRLPKNRNPY